MSWKSDADQWWEFMDASTPWTFRLQPERPEFGVLVGRSHSHSDAGPLFRILPPACDAPANQSSAPLFPALEEVYTRGPSLIYTLPQDSIHHFGLSVHHRVVQASDSSIVVETVLSVQTDLLDSHPTIDLLCCNVDGEVHGITEQISNQNPILPLKFSSDIHHPPIATRFIRSAHLGSALIIVPPTDRATAIIVESESGSARYRLLAEFMEKGVIRKSRFWTCLWTSPPQTESIEKLYHSLLDEPLPLTC